MKSDQKLFDLCSRFCKWSTGVSWNNWIHCHLLDDNCNNCLLSMQEWTLLKIIFIESHQHLSKLPVANTHRVLVHQLHKYFWRLFHLWWRGCQTFLESRKDERFWRFGDIKRKIKVNNLKIKYFSKKLASSLSSCSWRKRRNIRVQRFAGCQKIFLICRIIKFDHS